MKQNDMDGEHVPLIVAACCSLRNICEIHGSQFVDSWMENTTTVH